jgi:hypothetical protein
LAPRPPPIPRVAEAGDLSLVSHEPHERHPIAVKDRASECGGLRGGVDGGALRADPHPPPERPESGVELDADAHRRAHRCPLCSLPARPVDELPARPVGGDPIPANGPLEQL